eukprot:CAMPEP_0181107088 /NCGR_PEP_ID=MMETSP1071-20121207/16892_1 /TAXON_ID=35127 /ORGANISM="Thalassiosira sp., Strain NH16" /LENGTH=208 /DNA_ID=CAMNT_0023190565 /DNA_START=462 /DNA_END=1088 /DNA_ORIENTATION=+
MALSAPPIVFFKDNFYSLYRVEGSSMEPSLYHGDVLLVRKSDVFPGTMWKRWMSLASSYEEEEDHQNAVRVMALDASMGSPIGDWWSGNTYLKPPMIHRIGSVIVFKAPDATKYPSREFRVKRVIGLGGQICRASGNFHRLEKVPPFSLWVEGDNQQLAQVDSRKYGAVCKNNVIGLAEFIVWPPSRFGVIPCLTSPMPRSWWPNNPE